MHAMCSVLPAIMPSLTRRSISPTRMKTAWPNSGIATHQPQFEAGEQATFAIVLQATSELVGAIGLVINRRFDRAELGYWIGRPYWNQDYTRRPDVPSYRTGSQN